MATTIQGN